MKYSWSRATLWIISYLAVAAAPMILALIGPEVEVRDFWTEFSVKLGFVGFAIMGMQFVLTGRFRQFAARFGVDSMWQFHRQAGLVAFFFILAHPIILLLSDAQYLEYLDPRVNFLRAVSLSAATAGLIVLIVATLWREPIGLSYEWWRVSHGIIALLIMLVGIAHILQVGFYISTLWQQTILVGMTAGAFWFLIDARLLKPLRMRKKPYRVVEVKEERGKTWTLTLEPDGHEGMRYRPGQFAWITLGNTPFSLQQHPFSFSSSAESPYISLSIKELGDFSRTVKDIAPGSRAFLEGPYGYFVPDPDPAVGAIFIVGGIGITPTLSMMRTFRDRQDPRQMVLFYGNPKLEVAPFKEELDAIEKNTNLKVIHVLDSPPEDWQGEKGFITQEVLRRHIPGDLSTYEYFICGPDPMMDAVETALLKMGAPWKRVFSERFKIV